MKMPPEVYKELVNRRTCRFCKKRNTLGVAKCRDCGRNAETFRPFRMNIRKS